MRCAWDALALLCSCCWAAACLTTEDGLYLQAEGLKHSPRMVITPRQVQDNSEEISTLKAELATLKDEVGASLTEQNS